MRRVFTTRPDTTVPPTTVSTTAQAVPPKLTVKKFINGRDDHALVTAGEDMTITYRVSNEGSMRIDDIRLTDAVKEGNAALQQAIDAQLGKVAPFALAPGESRDVEVTVKAPAGRHDDTVHVTVPPVTEVPVTTTTTQLPPKDDVLGKCVANAVRSPILYMVPLLAIGNMFGEVATPYVKAINDQFNEISAEIQDEIRRKTPSYDFGIHGGHDNEQAAELRATVDAANRMLQELASRPDVQEYGKWAAIAMGVVVAGSRHPQQRLVHHRPPWRRPGAGVGVRVGVGCSVRHGDHLRDDDGPARHGDPGSW